MDAEREPTDGRSAASSAYALDRLWRAIDTATTHDDPAVRARAEQKALAWESVLGGMTSGVLDVGSRTPVPDTPAWVTLEVVHGGFATGRYVAEGPLDDAELSWLGALPTSVPGSTDRARLNSWFLTDEGLAILERALHEGTYVVAVPEHGALLVVAWLLFNGHDALALELVTELYPLMDRLRFYPVLTEAPPASSAVIHLRTVGEVREQLREVRTPHQIAAMNEALLVWRPLYDRLVELWLDTVHEDWPCAFWPSDWSVRRAQWLSGYRAAATAHTLCSDHRRQRSNFAILRSALEACPNDSAQLTGRDVGRVRMVLRRSVERWGAPRSEQLQRLRGQQVTWATRPTNAQLAAGVVGRLERLPEDAGLADPAAVLAPIEIDGELHEAPHTLTKKVERAREAPIEELVATRIVPSSEVLAAVLPQITAHVAAASVADPSLRDLYAGVYAAFRRRRSLLLLNLGHQVQIEELPWVRSLEPFRLTTSDARDGARRTLREATLLALTSFPQTILPNPMIREMSALAKQAELDVPLVEEVAADIFMGTFTAKWREAAALASSLMTGTLYARYYDLPEPSTWSGDRPRAKQRWLVIRRSSLPVVDDFAVRCGDRAKEGAAGDGNFVARNGTVIEQSQILTTHNLAPLVELLDLQVDLERRAVGLAVKTFDWIVREQNTDYRTWHSKLQMVKNTAYAWRQAIFFLSFAPESEQEGALSSLRFIVGAAPDEWQHRFEPAISGLEAIARGGRFDSSGFSGRSRRFLGWSVGPHWILPTAESLTPRR